MMPLRKISFDWSQIAPKLIRRMENKTARPKMITPLIAAAIIFIAPPYHAAAQNGTKTEAQTGCAALDGLLKTVAMAQDLKSEDTLNILLSTHAEELLDVLEKEKLAREASVISQYFSQVKPIITPNGAALNETQTVSLASSITPEFLSSLTSLNNYWGCSKAREADDLSALNQPETAQFYGTQNSTIQNITSRKPDPSAAKFMRQMGETSGRTTSRVAINGVRLSPRATVALVLLGFVTLLGGLVLYLRRFKIYEAREARSLVHSPILVKLDNEKHHMQLVDISMNGAKIKHEKAVNDHRTMLLKLGSNWHIGNIRWHNDIFAGVSFKSPLDEASLKTILKSAPSRADIN